MRAGLAEPSGRAAAASVSAGKNPSQDRRKSCAAVVSREGTGAEGEKMERQLEINASKVHPDVPLKFQPTPTHISLKNRCDPGTLENQQGETQGDVEFKSSRNFEK